MFHQIVRVCVCLCISGRAQPTHLWARPSRVLRVSDSRTYIRKRGVRALGAAPMILRWCWLSLHGVMAICFCSGVCLRRRRHHQHRWRGRKHTGSSSLGLIDKPFYRVQTYVFKCKHTVHRNTHTGAKWCCSPYLFAYFYGV